jgi:two-component system, chemotaxis family, chemotaxis protein CheY
MAAGEPARKRKVLIIDDDRDIREVLGDVLADEGFTIEAAWNGAEALKRLQAGFRPDVIILDLMMPVMDGMAFQKELKQNPELASIPVIGVTAAPSFDTDFETLRKPLKLDALISRIQTRLH